MMFPGSILCISLQEFVMTFYKSRMRVIPFVIGVLLTTANILQANDVLNL